MKSYAKRDMPALRPFSHLITITTGIGVGGSSCLRCFKERFAKFPYRYASGGDMMRLRGRNLGFPTIESFVAHMHEHPDEDQHDLWCDGSLAAFGRQNYCFIEATLAHLVPRAYRVLLECDLDVVVARRAKETGAPSAASIRLDIEDRAAKDRQRFEMRYPGSTWAREDFDLSIDTEKCSPAEKVAETILAEHALWLENLGPGNVITDVEPPSPE